MVGTTLTHSTPVMNLQSLLDALPDLSPSDRALVTRAYARAEKAHENQFRKSGEPFFTHCVAVAHILAEMRLDAEAICAALLHDIIEDTSVRYEDVLAEFGDTVANIVDAVTKLDKLPKQAKPDTPDKSRRANDREVEYMEYMRKIFMTMGDDVRVALVKLADRLHNMRTLGYMTPEKQKTVARETLDIFAPLANRLGIWQLKWQLEDLSFRYLYPDDYKDLARRIDEKRDDRERYMNEVITTLREEILKHGVKNPTISGRPKHMYSIFKKMDRKDMPFENIYDVRAVRVIVDTVPDCYLVLGIVHNMWKPVPGEFDDYIASPKDNFYRSLHTAVRDNRGKTVEVQIRTWEMHEHAEYGVAAHWRYKEGNKKDRDDNFEQRIAYIRRLMDQGDMDDPRQFVDHMKSEVFQDRVYVFTPKGDVFDLVVGATPVDFAYHVHTEIGHQCRGAKVNGKLVGLDYVLKTGDQIEIITSKRGGPSMDWLNPNLGYVKTDRARAKIRHWFRRQDRDKHIAMGREVLERELKRLGLLDVMSFESVATHFGFDKLDDFLANVGAGDINGGQIVSKILDVERKEQAARDKETLKARSSPSGLTVDPGNGVSILGTSGMLITLAKCCRPVPPEEIVGYVTRGRGVTVHRSDCPNINAEPERIIPVEWGRPSQTNRYSVPIELVAYDREALMKDISTLIADEKVNMSAVNVNVNQGIAHMDITLEITDLQHLQRILARLSNIGSVREVRRRTH
ncbi:MAG: bifunctional (p)ppGpp synthetase/guanosine-3',5'-bis(diphosphate) 3'-pyrophosphohydrolase [Pleurocapsa minor GSE-CHR-MK-17-07R]|nr:bifunctional (p)ppGpp synthetase/guanosine-3',5'-bis(diphosphate) 3'-pyrophosphohydrolase [Pleurocapsa minor GSE-CHR-MK 17-07R]